MPRKLYMQTRLFNINDRLASLELCERIDSWSEQGLLADMVPCFLPYRDNPIPPGTHPDDIGRWIFQEDAELLEQCAGIVGFFDGASYDQGCAFEVGCGYCLGLPVNLITTDFYKWTVGDSEEYYIGSKLLEHVAKLVRITDQNPSMSYRERSEDQFERVIEAYKANLIEDFGTIRPKRAPLTALPIKYDYYLDPNFKYTEAGQYLLESIKKILTEAGKTYIVGNNQDDIEEDITNLRKSGQAIIYADVFEPNLDSGILHGIAYGIGRKPLIYASNKQKYTGGSIGDTSNVGVMLLYSAEAAVPSLAKLKEYITNK